MMASGGQAMGRERGQRGQQSHSPSRFHDNFERPGMRQRQGAGDGPSLASSSRPGARGRAKKADRPLYVPKPKRQQMEMEAQSEAGIQDQHYLPSSSRQRSWKDVQMMASGGQAMGRERGQVGQQSHSPSRFHDNFERPGMLQRQGAGDGPSLASSSRPGARGRAKKADRPLYVPKPKRQQMEMEAQSEAGTRDQHYPPSSSRQRNGYSHPALLPPHNGMPAEARRPSDENACGQHRMLESGSSSPKKPSTGRGRRERELYVPRAKRGVDSTSSAGEHSSSSVMATCDTTARYEGETSLHQEHLQSHISVGSPCSAPESSATSEKKSSKAHNKPLASKETSEARRKSKTKKTEATGEAAQGKKLRRKKKSEQHSPGLSVPHRGEVVPSVPLDPVPVSVGHSQGRVSQSPEMSSERDRPRACVESTGLDEVIPMSIDSSVTPDSVKEDSLVSCSETAKEEESTDVEVLKENWANEGSGGDAAKNSSPTSEKDPMASASLPSKAEGSEEPAEMDTKPSSTPQHGETIVSEKKSSQSSDSTERDPVTSASLPSEAEGTAAKDSSPTSEKDPMASASLPSKAEGSEEPAEMDTKPSSTPQHGETIVSEKTSSQSSERDPVTSASLPSEADGAAVPDELKDKSPSSAFQHSETVASEKAISPTPGSTGKNSPQESPPEEDSWEALFDEDGDFVEDSVKEEISSHVGQVKMEKKTIDYLNYKPRPRSPDENFDDCDHLIEIYDFPERFKDVDLISIFRDYKDRGFDLKWVDDTHVVGVFASPFAAVEALSQPYLCLKVRPISEASQQTRDRVKRRQEFLQPYKERPETTSMVAGNLIAKYLGLRNAGQNKEKREQQRKQLREAKEKKRQKAQAQEDAWEGTIKNMASVDKA